LTQANKVGGWGGMALAILLAVVAFAHHQQTGGQDLGIFYFSLIFAVLHMLVFGLRIARK
jgi:basic amino acid/polyamine antiporter, APA family